MATYQGHRSWNAWNVALYIDNEEWIYRAAIDAKRKARNLDQAVRLFGRATGLIGTKTPDGAVYNKLSVKEAIADLEV